MWVITREGVSVYSTLTMWVRDRSSPDSAKVSLVQGEETESWSCMVK